MATLKQCVSDIFTLTTDVIHAARPIGQAVSYSTAAAAEAAGQLLVAVAMTTDERKQAQEILELYK